MPPLQTMERQSSGAGPLRSRGHRQAAPGRVRIHRRDLEEQQRDPELAPHARERAVFHNDGQLIACPLVTMFGASNELPERKELEALFDRFLLRYEVGYLIRPANL